MVWGGSLAFACAEVNSPALNVGVRLVLGFQLGLLRRLWLWLLRACGGCRAARSLVPWGSAIKRAKPTPYRRQKGHRNRPEPNTTPKANRRKGETKPPTRANSWFGTTEPLLMQFGFFTSPSAWVVPRFRGFLPPFLVCIRCWFPPLCGGGFGF